VDVAGLGGPATLWFVTSGSATALASAERPEIHVLDARPTATRWWRLEVRMGTVQNGDLLVLTNPVFVEGR
jgi:hypothetical protein